METLFALPRSDNARRALVAASPKLCELAIDVLDALLKSLQPFVAPQSKIMKGPSQRAYLPAARLLPIGSHIPLSQSDFNLLLD